MVVLERNGLETSENDVAQGFEGLVARVVVIVSIDGRLPARFLLIVVALIVVTGDGNIKSPERGEGLSAMILETFVTCPSDKLLLIFHGAVFPVRSLGPAMPSKRR